jgi:hypothetical protein
MRADPAVRRFRVTTRAKANRPGTWDSTIVTILDGDVEVGSYERSYPSFAADTFEPFEQNGRWYALYSANHTCTRIMTLPDCKDIGGEESHGGGFCPVELFVPRYRELIWTKPNDAPWGAHRSWVFEAEANGLRDEDKVGRTDMRQTVGPWRTLDIAFVAGCVWGDDSSWKLQVFDLSRVSEGILTRSERFGFVQLGTMPLVKAVRCHFNDDGPLRATIIREEDRDVQTGALVDPYE